MTMHAPIASHGRGTVRLASLLRLLAKPATLRCVCGAALRPAEDMGRITQHITRYCGCGATTHHTVRPTHTVQGAS